MRTSLRIACLAALASASAFAGTNAFTRTGPSGGAVVDIEFVSGGGGANSCVITGLELTCSVGVLAGRASTTVSVSYTPTSAGSWSAMVTAYEPDASAADNTASVNVGAAPPPGPGSSSGGGGGGGSLDYLLLALLAGAATLRRR